MKTTRALLFFLVAAATIVSVARAQVEFYLIEKRQQFIQTSSAAPGADPLVPFRFSAEIESNNVDISSLANHAFTPPGGSLTNTPTVTPDRFQFRQDFGTQAAMDAAFPNGTYSVDVGNVTGINLGLTGNL